MADVEAQKRIKALTKKLAQIAKLKGKAALSREEAAKVASEEIILKEIAALERGVPVDVARQEFAAADEPEESPTSSAAKEQKEAEPVQEPAAAQPAPVEEEPPVVPRQDLEPAEADRRVKALKKKLTQIQKLKQKETPLLPEEAEKVASEVAFQREALELELGLLAPEVQKDALVLVEKLEEIAKLRRAHGKDEPVKAKDKALLSKEATLKKELDLILAARPVIRQPAAATQVQPAAARVETKARKPQPQQPQPRADPAADAPERPKEAARQSCWADEPVFDDADLPAILEAAGLDVPGEFLAQKEDDFVNFESRSTRYRNRAQAKAEAAEQEAAARAAARREASEQKAAERAAREAEEAARVQAVAERAMEKARLAVQASLNGKASRASWADADCESDGDLEAWQAVLPAVQQAASPARAQQTPKDDSPEAKRLKALRKKLTQIQNLKARAGKLSAEEAAKVATESSLAAEIADLERTR